MKINFHGYLKDLCPGEYEFSVKTIAEAIRAISSQLPGLKPHPVNGRHMLSIVGCDSEEDLYKAFEGDSIDIVPAFVGNKSGSSGGWVQIVLGTVLVVVGVVLAVYGYGAGIPLVTMGLGMILGGVSQLLAPTPERSKGKDDPESSKYLGAPKNTTEYGTPIPIGYGEFKCFGHYLSFNIDA